MTLDVMKSHISSGNMSTAEVSKTIKGLPSVESDVMLERDGTLPEQKLERKRSLTHDLIGFAKHNMNPAVSFLLLASQLYLTYLAIFEISFLDPFQTSNSMTQDNFTDGTTPREEVNAIFGTSTLSILVIVLAGLAGAALVQFCRLPGLLGMLLAGILLRNMPYTGAVMLVVKEWGVVLRRLAFIVILLRGGLSLDVNALRKLKGACFRLALIPCTVEAVAVAAASRLILGMDILYGLMLGFVLAAVSPAVIVPAMLDAAANGYGTGAGIPSLVVAAASLDDVYAITMFSLLVSVVFSTGSSIVVTLIRAPIEVVSGVFFGTIIGLVLRYFPSSSHRHFHAFRFSLLAAFACSALFGTTALGVDSIGAIAVLVLAFVASQRWKSDEMSRVSREEDSKSSELEDEDRETEIPQLAEEYGLAVAWECVFQPLLFGLIGFQLSFDMLSLRTVSLGLVVLCVGLVFRTIATSLAVLGSGLDFKERLFVSLAWLPKATVQAALAPVALDMARSRHDDPDEESVVFSTLIFAVAVLSILTTAPIGALVIQLTTPKLLKKGNPPDGVSNAGIA